MALRRTAKKLDDVDVSDTTVHKTYRWIDEISEELGGIGRREAYRDELGAQLPMLVRGIYCEAWDPSHSLR